MSKKYQSKTVNQEEHQGAPESAPESAPERAPAKDDQQEDPKDTSMLGFLAVHPTGGSKETAFPGRMIAFPVMPGFDEKGPLKGLDVQLRERNPYGKWRGYAVILKAGKPEIVPI